MLDNPDNAAPDPTVAADEVAPADVPRDDAGVALADEHPELGAGGVVPADAPAGAPADAAPDAALAADEEVDTEPDAPHWVVQANETGLSQVVARLYGLAEDSPDNAALTAELLNLNSNVIGSDPNALNVGSVLMLTGHPNLPQEPE